MLREPNHTMHTGILRAACHLETRLRLQGYTLKGRKMSGGAHGT